MRYTARAPLRIDFGGGWTDVPLYAETEGGAVLNAAITRYVEGYISRPTGDGPLHALRGDRSYVSYTLDLPAGAGLGASAAQNVLWLTLVRTTIANVADRAEIAEAAWRVGGLLGILGGKQDEYASALGGIAYYTFGDSVKAERLDLPLTVLDEMRRRLVLVYSGAQRLSSTVHERVWERYGAGDREVVQALSNLKRLAGDMRDAVRSSDLDSLGALLSENWASQKNLHATITNSMLDELYTVALSNGAVGGKACGAGGGGCFVFMSRDGQAQRLRHALSSRGYRVFDFDFDTYGVFLKKA